MDNTRLFLWLGLLAMLWLNYSTWLTDRAPEPAVPPPPSPSAVDAPPVAPVDDTLPDIGDAATPTRVVEADEPAGAPSAPIRVRTDVLDVLIDTQGGDLIRADIPEYPVHKDAPHEPVRLLDYTPSQRWVFQTGLRSAADGPEPNHLAAWRADSTSYELAPGQDELLVRLEWADTGPVSATKTYTFRRGEYRIDLEMNLENGADVPWRGASYAQMLRVHRPPGRSYVSVETYSFTGPVLYDGDSYDKLDFDDLRRSPLTQTLRGGWMAGIQHHFLAAAVPPADQDVRYQAATRDEQYVLTAVGPVETVEPATTHTFPYTLFVGPKLQDQLERTADGLELTVDYGMLTILAQPLFWVLSHVHDVVRNWGWSIIIVTMLIKLVFYKLTQTSGRSMAKMRKLAPRMKALQERYKDDRQALSRAMMEMYRKEKVNPAAGCLPILVQMPFFFAFYWVLIESVEMRQAPFVLWINDLSSRDPYFVLPLLMGAAMFFQTKLNPAPPDPMQARIMQIMPIVFTAMFALFPSGLVLYWLTNTVLSILQQWRINQVVARES
jgi:YidC/Oxa1 family membrane protein insertase